MRNHIIDQTIEANRLRRIQAERMGWTLAAMTVGVLFLGLVAVYV